MACEAKIGCKFPIVLVMVCKNVSRICPSVEITTMERANAIKIHTLTIDLAPSMIASVV